MIRTLYPSKGPSGLATMLGRTENAIKLRAKRLGVKREQDYHERRNEKAA